MNKVRTILFNLIPYITWLMLISIGYAFFAFQLDSQIHIDKIVYVETYFIEGTFLIIPIIILRLLTEKIRTIWQYLPLVLLVIVATYFLSPSFYFFGFVFVIAFALFVSRANNEKNFLSDVNILVQLLYVAYFLLAGFTDGVFLQKVTVYYFIISSVLIFIFKGCKRFDEYIYLRKSGCYIPTKRILDVGTRNFLIFAGIMILIITPLIRNNYEFVEFSLPEINDEFEEELIEMEAKIEYESDGDGSGDYLKMLREDYDEDKILHKIMEFLGEVAVVVTYIAIAIMLFKCAVTLVKSFNKGYTSKEDVVQSTFIQNEEIVEEIKRRIINESIFNMSREKKIRQRYKKEFNKYKPKLWQTPTEIEVMANKEASELHDLYEEARYGNH